MTTEAPGNAELLTLGVKLWEVVHSVLFGQIVLVTTQSAKGEPREHSCKCQIDGGPSRGACASDWGGRAPCAAPLANQRFPRPFSPTSELPICMGRGMVIAKNNTMGQKTKFYIVGRHGLVSGATAQRQRTRGFIVIGRRASVESGLCRQAYVEAVFVAECPENVFPAAAKVGGIPAAATCLAGFLRDNLLIQTNLADAAWRYGLKETPPRGSTCLRPSSASQSTRKDAPLTGRLEFTNEPCALTKIVAMDWYTAPWYAPGLSELDKE